MTVVLGLLAGYLSGRLVLIVARPVLGHPGLLRTNHRGAAVPTAAGVVVPLAVVLVEAGRAVAGRLGLGEAGATPARTAVLVTAVGFALLGLVDDLLGDEARGFRGHVAALARGRATTGAIKLAGGAALAVVVVAGLSEPGAAQLLADAALVALCANLGNLFDRAPGRAGKVAIVGFVVLAAATRAPAALAATAVVVGAGGSLLPDDLRERLMLGDTGANALGAAVGLATVLATAPVVRLGVLAAVAAANALSEVVSFSKVIDAVPPLRALDRAGRRG